MKMVQKLLIFACFVFAAACALSSIAFAHPGRTDSNGGHYVTATGEYHYHHGYPAHDHYDIDGDGVLDCPYTYVAKATPAPTPSRAIASGGHVVVTANPELYQAAVESAAFERVGSSTEEPQQSYLKVGWIISVVAAFIGGVLFHKWLSTPSDKSAAQPVQPAPAPVRPRESQPSNVHICYRDVPHEIDYRGIFGEKPPEAPRFQAEKHSRQKLDEGWTVLIVFLIVFTLLCILVVVSLS